MKSLPAGLRIWLIIEDIDGRWAIGPAWSGVGNGELPMNLNIRESGRDRCTRGTFLFCTFILYGT